MKLFRIAGYAAMVLLLVAAISLVAGHVSFAGPFIIGFFAVLALAVRGNVALKGFSYTALIFSTVALALYYPAWFISWGDFKLSVLITPLIQLIMFGMGTRMSLQDFSGVIKMPKGVAAGVFCQFTIMPLTGFLLANVSGLQPEIAAGIVLIGCSPSGMASNVIAYLAKANLALSVTITAITTLLAPIVTPFLMKLLAGQFIEIAATSMMWDIFKMVILPIGAGLLFNKILAGKSKWLDGVMPLLSMFGIAFSIVVITAAGRDSMLTIGPLLIVLVLIHNTAGYALGYWSGRLLRMDERDCRTIAIEVGMQNGGLASGIAREMGKLATVGLAAAVFGPLMNITGSVLASWWQKRPTHQTKKNDKQADDILLEM